MNKHQKVPEVKKNYYKFKKVKKVAKSCESLKSQYVKLIMPKAHERGNQ